MSFRHTVLAGALPALLLSGCAQRSQAPAETRLQRPAVVVISIDTLRADHLPAYGYHGVDTPNLDALAASGMRFASTWSPCPTTLCSHSSVFTGLYPTTHQVRDNIGYRLDTKEHRTFAQALGAAGYETAAFVSAYVLRARAGLGAAFDRYDDGLEVEAGVSIGHLERPGTQTVAAALRWLDQRGADSRPFLLFVHLFEPHTPYAAPPPFGSRYTNPYDAEIAAADAAVGTLLDGLRSHGVFDDALIVLLGDHGEGLGDHGEKEHGILLNRETLHVPLLVKLPRDARAGTVVTTPTSLVDVASTVLDVTGVDAPLATEGTSLLAIADGALPTHRQIYSETYYARLHFGWSELLSLADDRYHLIEGPGPELYDVVNDPREEHNLLDQQPDEVQRLRAKLEARRTPLVLPGADALDSGDASRLAVLGYVTQVVEMPNDQPLADPKQALPVLDRVQHAFDLGGQGHYREAVAILRELIATYPGMLDARFQLASNLAFLGDTDGAIAAYREILEVSPQVRSGVMIEIARLEARRRRFDEAEAAAASAVDALPSEANEILAQVALARGDGVQALSLAQAAVAAEQVPRAEALLLLGQIYTLAGDYQLALATFEQVRARVADGQRPPLRGLELERGEALARLERYPEAEQAFELELSHFPGNLRAYTRLAVLYAATHRPEEIDPLLERMVAVDPQRTAAYEAAAETVERLGASEVAKEWRRRKEAVRGR